MMLLEASVSGSRWEWRGPGVGVGSVRVSGIRNVLGRREGPDGVRQAWGLCFLSLVWGLWKLTGLSPERILASGAEAEPSCHPPQAWKGPRAHTGCSEVVLGGAPIPRSPLASRSIRGSGGLEVGPLPLLPPPWKWPGARPLASRLWIW